MLFFKKKQKVIITIHGFGKNVQHEFDPLAKHIDKKKYHVNLSEGADGCFSHKASQLVSCLVYSRRVYEYELNAVATLIKVCIYTSDAVSCSLRLVRCNCYFLSEY